MPQITNPFDALVLYQQALQAGLIPLTRCEFDKDLFVCVDQPNGMRRFSYLRVDGQTISTLVMLVDARDEQGLPCFSIGYAVPENYRGRGLARTTVIAAIRELKAGLSGAGVKAFYVEAVVGLDNTASQKVAATISAQAIPITDEVSGFPALHYINRYS